MYCALGLLPKWREGKKKTKEKRRKKKRGGGVKQCLQASGPGGRGDTVGAQPGTRPVGQGCCSRVQVPVV